MCDFTATDQTCVVVPPILQINCPVETKHARNDGPLRCYVNNSLDYFRPDLSHSSIY